MKNESPLSHSSRYTHSPMTLTTRHRLLLGCLCLLGASRAFAADPLDISHGRRVSFDAGWRFHKGDAPGAERPHFDDSALARLDLPHDWAIEGPFDVEHRPAHRRAARLRHRLVPQAVHRSRPAREGRYFSVEFDGAMSNATRLAERPRARRPALRLQRLRLGPHAAPAVRRRRERARGAARARGAGSRAGIRAPASTATSGSMSPARARRALGNLRHHARA